MILEELVSIGFGIEEAKKLAESTGFHHRKKTRQELTDLFNKISGVYNCTFEEVKRAVLSFPRFAGYDHERVVRQGIKVYGVVNKDKVKRAVLSFPQFAGLDHERVVRQKTRLGRMARLSDREVINYLLDVPALAGYSAKRYLAAFDIGRQLESEGFSQDERMLKAFFSYSVKSPYVPDTKRKRISQVVSDKEPPLLKAMRKRLERQFIRVHNPYSYNKFNKL